MNEVLRTSGRRYATSASTAGRSRIAATTFHVPSPGSGGPPARGISGTASTASRCASDREASAATAARHRFFGRAGRPRGGGARRSDGTTPASASDDGTITSRRPTAPPRFVSARSRCQTNTLRENQADDQVRRAEKTYSYDTERVLLADSDQKTSVQQDAGLFRDDTV